MKTIHLLAVALIGCVTGIASGFVATTSEPPSIAVESDGHAVLTERWYHRLFGLTRTQADEPWQSYESARAQAIERGRPLLVLIKMNGCAPCVVTQSAIEQLHASGDLSKYEVAVVNVDDSSRHYALAMRLTGMQVARGLPQLVLYEPRPEQSPPPKWSVRRHVGGLTAAELTEWLAR